MSEPIEAINQLARDETSAFQNSIEDMLMDRLRDRIENQKVAVGMSMYQGEEDIDVEDVEYEEPEFEEGTDEEV